MMNEMDTNRFMPSFENRIELGELQRRMDDVRREIKKVIVGQDKVITMLQVAILTGGHSLLEGVPGVAKTMMARLAAKAVQCTFKRIQFTPDLMPSDVTGTTILDLKVNEFEFKPGPIFGNIVLIDEINRAPAKTQASLFECMSERQVTVDGVSYPLEAPFLVLATQNPIEHEGTYRLPEAQLDRFLFKIEIDYPDFEQELEMLREHSTHQLSNKEHLINQVLTTKELLDFQELVKQIFVHEDILNYIVQVVLQTRSNPSLYLGASPRASMALLEASKSFAALQGRDFVTPDDVKYLAPATLGHRVMLTPEREMEGFTTHHIINQIVDGVDIPR